MAWATVTWGGIMPPPDSLQIIGMTVEGVSQAGVTPLRNRMTAGRPQGGWWQLGLGDH